MIEVCRDWLGARVCEPCGPCRTHHTAIIQMAFVTASDPIGVRASHQPRCTVARSVETVKKRIAHLMMDKLLVGVQSVTTRFSLVLSARVFRRCAATAASSCIASRIVPTYSRPARHKSPPVNNTNWSAKMRFLQCVRSRT